MAGLGDTQLELRYLRKGTGCLRPGLYLAIPNRLPSLMPAPRKPPKPLFAPRLSVNIISCAQCAGAQMSSAVSIPTCSSSWCSQSLVQTSPGEGAENTAGWLRLAPLLLPNISSYF